MKKNSLIILFMVLFVGIVSIAGDIMLKKDIEQLSRNYTEVVDEHTVNRMYMTRITALAYEHQSVVAKYLITEETDRYDSIEAETEAIRKELMQELSEFGRRMKGDKREQLYHNVYSNINSYINNAEVAMNLIKHDNRNTANYYYTNTMDSFLDKVSESIKELDSYTVDCVNESKTAMEERMAMSEVTEAVSMGFVVLFTAIAVFFCVGITRDLEDYKDKLEKEIEVKNDAIRKHNEKMLSIQDNTIIGMANLIEKRDGDTGEHVKRTSTYVGKLAKATKKAGYYTDILTDEYIELLIKAAPMHDVGKIIISDTILNKPGKLTPEEFEEIKKHAAEGGRIVREVLENIEEEEYVQLAAQIATGHHEKWDGSGYPAGLSGEEIPLGARIMAVADVFDALISKRCYKAAMSYDEAFDIIKASAGTHFDPVLAKVFVESREDIVNA